MRKTLISIVGPTAVGKTKVAIELAKKFNSQIISADSRQCYKEMTIGTAKPSREELNAVDHHFIDSHSIHDFFSAGEFEKMALAKISTLHQDIDPIIMVGGSGLYVDAVTKGLADIPKISDHIRANLVKRLEAEGLDALFTYLEETDLEYAKLVDKHNPQRIIRALEVYEGTGKTYSRWRNASTEKRVFDIISIGLELDRETLYKRIDDRMDVMIDLGLFQEADVLFEFRNLSPLRTVGYKEIFDYKLGEYDYNECVRLLKRNSRRYAKRQFTWFKKNPETRWYHPNELNNMIDLINRSLR